jgi:hypothetical protein
MFLEHHADSLSEEAANALGEIGDHRAVPFLMDAMQRKLYVREGYIKLACYRAIQRISEAEIPPAFTRLLVEALATEIIRLYRRIQTVLWGEFDWSIDDDPVRVIRMENEASPDIDGVRALAAQIPEDLREQVRALVNEESKMLF